VQLPPQNKGFLLLAKLGFDELDGGLGAQRQGRREPVATSLKLDRRGLGRAPPPPPPGAGAADAAARSFASCAASSASSSSRAPTSKPAPRRVTHFPAHQPHQEAEGGVSRAKAAQDALGSHKRRGGSESGRGSSGSGGLGVGNGSRSSRGGGNGSGGGANGGGGGGGKRRRGGASERRTLEERLATKREGALRRELSGSVPEGFDEYF
jgi:hypothetical protein